MSSCMNQLGWSKGQGPTRDISVSKSPLLSRGTNIFDLQGSGCSSRRNSRVVVPNSSASVAKEVARIDLQLDVMHVSIRHGWGRSERERLVLEP